MIDESPWATVERRLGDPAAAAVRLLEALLAQSPGVALDGLRGALVTLDESALQRLAHLIQVESYHATQSGAETTTRTLLTEMAHVVEEAFSQRASEFPPLESPNSHKLARYSALLQRYNETMARHSPAHASERLDVLRPLLDDVVALRHVTPHDYLTLDLTELHCGVLESLAACHLTLGGVADAGRRYEEAIGIADVQELKALARALRLKLAELVATREGEVDTALRELLPLVQQMRDQPPSLERALITIQLAEVTFRAGDTFDARRLVRESDTLLQRAGYPAPSPDRITEVLADWIATADRTTTTPTAFRSALHRVPVAYMSLAHLRHRLTSSSEHQQPLVDLLDALGALVDEIVARDQALAARGRETLERFWARTMSVSSPEAPEDPALFAFSDRLTALIERMDALQAHIAAGGPAGPLLAEAEALEAEARAINERRLAATLLLDQADLYLATGDEERAIERLRAAHDLASGEGRHDDTLHYLWRIALIYAERQDHIALSALCAEAIELIERLRLNVSPPYLQSAFLSDQINFFALGVLSAFKLGAHELMLERMERSKARASLRAFHHRATSVPDADVERLESELRALQAALRGANAEQATALREKRRVLWDLLAIRHADRQRQQPPPEFSLRALQQTLESSEAIVYHYWLGPGVLMVVALDQEQVRVSRQLMSDETYARLVEMVEQLGSARAASIDPTRLNAFAPHLLPEDVYPVLQDKSHLLISPHRLLHAFPFHALRWRGQYLIGRFAVSYIPNLTSRLVRFPATTHRAVLAVGTTHYAIPTHPLPSLPGVGAEMEDLHTVYATHGIQIDLLRDEAASLQTMRAWASDGRLASYRILHFATHAQDVLSNTPMETQLCLFDGLLDGLEIAHWRLNADLVVLSACHSGRRAMKGRGLSELPGDELFGLQAAFFSAGARRVVGALWPAHDAATRFVMTRFHHYLTDLPPEYALQAAIKDYLRQATIRARNPFFWAPFFLSVMGRSAVPTES